jgi:uncharacterized protein
MPYIIYCIDRVDAGDLRRQTRAVHLEYMIRHRGDLLFGGPMQSEDGSRVKGSVMVLDYETRAEVDRFLAEEPYAVAGLFAEVRIERMVQMAPERVPGLLEAELEKERARL